MSFPDRLAVGMEGSAQRRKPMRRAIFLAILSMMVVPAQASRAVSDAERVKLVAAIAAQGCSGGKMVWDDTHFEVDEVVCDGRRATT